MYNAFRLCAISSILLLTGCATLSQTSINKEVGAPTQVIITLQGMSNEDGSLLVFIHDNEHSYYSDDNIDTSEITFFRKLNVPANAPSKQAIFDNIPAGKYAITAFHDEDNDGRLDRMVFPFMGMPSESYGSSNNSFSYLSKGDFTDALVDVSLPVTNITINLSTHLTKMVSE